MKAVFIRSHMLHRGQKLPRRQTVPCLAMVAALLNVTAHFHNPPLLPISPARLKPAAAGFEQPFGLLSSYMCDDVVPLRVLSFQQSCGDSCRPCRGVLLFGPPGTGKTLLARAAAAECGASFLAIHPSTVASKWLGDGVRYMRAVFSLASKLSPCVLFIDEVDALLAKRDSQREHEAHREIKNEFMAQWDGIRTGSSSSVDRVSLLIYTSWPVFAVLC